MAQNGSLIVHVYASRAQLPIQGATVLVSQPDGQGRHQLLSVLITDESGVAGETNRIVHISDGVIGLVEDNRDHHAAPRGEYFK